jgi:hypothetical protein
MTITTLELRGRDLVIIPAEQWQNLLLPALLLTLFGTYLPAAIRSSIVQDKQCGEAGPGAAAGSLYGCLR